MKNLKNEVLIIISGVIIDANSRNDDVINIANLKKDETELMSIEEEIKLELSENPPSNYDELIAALTNYGIVENSEDKDMATLVTTEGGYRIKVQNIWNINKVEIGMNIGDYVKYEFKDGTYTIEEDRIGNVSEVIVYADYNEDTEWRVIDVDSITGQVKIVPTNLTNLNLKLLGENGYNNAVKTLNELCNELFSNDELHSTARSINLDDIEKISSNINSIKGSDYGSQKEYEMASIPYVAIQEKQNSMQTNFYKGSKNDKLNAIQTYYSGEVLFKREKYNGIIPKGNYWLSSRSINNTDETAEYIINNMNSTNDNININGFSLYNSAGTSEENSYSILPIVILQNISIVNGNGEQYSPYEIEYNK